MSETAEPAGEHQFPSPLITPEDDTGEGRASLRLSLGWTPAGTPCVGWLWTRGPPNVCGDSRRVDAGGLSVCFAVTGTSVEKEGAWVPEERASPSGGRGLVPPW